MPSFDERGQVVFVEMMPGFPVKNPAWNSFVVDPEGPDTVEAPIAPGHETSIEGEELRVDGQPLYTAGGNLRALFSDRKNFKPFTAPATTAFASFNEAGTAVVYRGA